MKHRKLLIHVIRILIVILLLFLWEFCSRKEIINSFIFSSPSKIFNCLKDMIYNGNLLHHIYITLKEIIISFILSIITSFIIAVIFYEFKILFDIFEPLLTIINSTPKVAIGPLIIILFGAGIKSIIIMSLSITLILNILSIYNAFTNTNKNLERYLNSLNADKISKYKYLIIPSGLSVIISSLKINISMTLIGVIMGEFLVSKAGLGYLIVYGTQVFNLTLVMSSIIVLILISYILYICISFFENKIK